MRTPLPTPLALPLPCAHDFLQFVLSNTNNPPQHGQLDQLDQKPSDPTTLLVICSSRDQFIHNLLTVSHSASISPLHHLPHVSILSASSNIRIIFTPTIHHLRAYLTALIYTPPSSISPSNLSIDTQSKPLDQKPPMLAIWGLVEAHSDTTEYSAQGIGRTVATAVSAGLRNAMWVVVGGRRGMKRLHHRAGVGEFDVGDYDDEETASGKRGGATNMDVRVPVLNSTVKLGKEMDIVARGRVSVRDILQRWFIWKEQEEKEVCQEEGQSEHWHGTQESIGETVHEMEAKLQRQKETHIHDASKAASEVGESDDDEL